MFVCEFCGHQYANDYVQQWGRGGRGDGYGPRAKCTQLVPDPFVVTTGAAPMQVCGGPLTLASTP